MKFNILLIEDDEVDCINIQRTFKKLSISNPLYTVNDGVEALEFLDEKGEELKPLLILLDLNMPRMDGHEFLVELRKRKEFAITPVVVLTTSNDEEDKRKAYENTVAGYIVKPVDPMDFIERTAVLGKYWTLCEIP